MAINTAGATWVEVRTHTEREVDHLSAALESPLLPHDESQYIRGRLAAYRDILALPRLPHTDEPLAFVPEDVI